MSYSSASPVKGFECDLNRRCSEGLCNDSVVHLCDVRGIGDALSSLGFQILMGNI